MSAMQFLLLSEEEAAPVKAVDFGLVRVLRVVCEGGGVLERVWG